MYISYQMIVLTTLLLSQEWANVHMLKAQPPMHHQLVWYIIIAVRLLSNDGHKLWFENGHVLDSFNV